MKIYVSYIFRKPIIYWFFCILDTRNMVKTVMICISITKYILPNLWKYPSHVPDESSKIKTVLYNPRWCLYINIVCVCVYIIYTFIYADYLCKSHFRVDHYHRTRKITVSSYWNFSYLKICIDRFRVVYDAFNSYSYSNREMLNVYFRLSILWCALFGISILYSLSFSFKEYESSLTQIENLKIYTRISCEANYSRLYTWNIVNAWVEIKHFLKGEKIIQFIEVLGYTLLARFHYILKKLNYATDLWSYC